MARRRRRRSLPPDPVTLEIEKLSHDGRGIARVDGKTLFVDQALPGERVEAVYTDRRGQFDEARTTGVIVPSPERAEPRCRFATVCGGCSLQHFEPAAQLQFKEAVLHEKLAHHLGRTDFERFAAITGPVYGYRRKARLAVRYVGKKGKLLVGFREKGSSFITDMDSCAVLDPRVSDALPALSEGIAALDCFRHIPQIEVAAGDPGPEGHSWALVFRHLLPLGEGDRNNLIALAQACGFDLYLQPQGPASVHKVYPRETTERLYYQLPEHGVGFAFHPMDFTQVNADINRAMVARALELLEPQAGDRVLDLFCGLGNFTLPAARKTASVTGVEGGAAMVERGRENAARNGIENVTFHCTDLSESIADREWFRSPFNKVLLDPPRSGAREILADVARRKPERIVYISCNPATLARDAALLEAAGYRLAGAGVMDMFPHTAHVESIAAFNPVK